ncbi:MAG: DUF2237 domain-containing protein [Gammaproteobacteria bacterium]|nr:DUF2237 domain-containing protein [Gammaproteobacteria bacterium]
MGRSEDIDRHLNVFGEPLAPCSMKPMTGFYRDGCCRSGDDDPGRHVVCVEVTREFLQFSRARGNDLSTPVKAYGFPGLRPGDRWCLCGLRWKEAFDAGKAPRVVLAATHNSMLEIVDFSILKGFAVDMN